MKRSTPQAFTLVEMLTVMAIIAILTGLVISVGGYAQNKAARERALGEIQEMTTACESYKNDYGGYPQDSDTDLLDPRLDGNPNSGASFDRYKKSCLALYSALTGDTDGAASGKPDGRPEAGKKTYIDFKPNRLSYDKDANGNIKEVKYIQDPFGNCYGYSTMALKQEQEYRETVKKDPTAARPTAAQVKGYNPTFDMWSTGGQTDILNAAKWVKNWGN